MSKFTDTQKISLVLAIICLGISGIHSMYYGIKHPSINGINMAINNPIDMVLAVTGYFLIHFGVY